MTVDQLPPGLSRLGQVYQQTCELFNRGELSATEARELILGLSYTDAEGCIWRIDTKRSGRRAAFISETVDQVEETTEYFDDSPSSDPTPPEPTGYIGTNGIAVSNLDDVDHVPDIRHQQLTDRRIRRQIFIKALGVVIMLVAILFILLTDDSPKTTVSSLPISVTTTGTPLSPQNINIASFGTRGDVPFDVDLEFGRSVRDAPLLVHRRGDPDGVSVLVIGVIHGDEDAGLAVIDELRKTKFVDKIDLWLVPTMNPDGQVGTKTRQNANGVDLNRNFPTRWKPNELPGNWQYSGPSPGSEPEVQAMVRLGNLVQPVIVIWYHQDYFRISPSIGREGAIRERYASLAQLPPRDRGGSYSGTGAMWSKSIQGRMASVSPWSSVVSSPSR